MSVLIKGMEMPSECEYCGFCRYYSQNGNVWCNAKNKLLKERWINPHWTHLDVKKPEWCPLVEVPTPHGRLIDAGTLLTERRKSKYYHLTNGDIAIPVIDIEHAPTVIKAEDSES